MGLTDKLIAIGDGFRKSRGLTETFTLDEMAALAAESGPGDSSDDVRYVTFMNGDIVLYKKPVATGDDCVDVVAKGLLDAPTKASTNYYNYVYSGWALSKDGVYDAASLFNVTSDRTVYATFNESARYYTVRFFDGDTLVDTVQVTYGETAETKYNKANHILNNWLPSNKNIISDTDCYGDWTYVEYIEREIEDSWETIIASIEDGTYKQKYSLGNYKNVGWVGSKSYVQLVAFDTDELSDGSGKARTTWLPKMIGSKSSALSEYWLHNTSSLSGGWMNSSSYSRWYSTGTSINEAVKSAVKTVKKTSYVYDSASDSCSEVVTDEKFFMPSHREIFGDTEYEKSGPTYNIPAYSTAARRILKSNSSIPPSASAWFLRTQISSNRVRCVNTIGSSSTCRVNEPSTGLTLGFCI